MLEAENQVNSVQFYMKPNKTLIKTTLTTECCDWAQNFINAPTEALLTTNMPAVSRHHSGAKHA